MKRSLVIVAVVALLALPVVVGAQPTLIPPEVNWTPTPPARGIADTATARSTELLKKKSVLTPQEQAEVMQPQVAMPTGKNRQPARESSLEFFTSP